MGGGSRRGGGRVRVGWPPMVMCGKMRFGMELKELREAYGLTGASWRRVATADFWQDPTAPHLGGQHIGVGTEKEHLQAEG